MGGIIADEKEGVLGSLGLRQETIDGVSEGEMESAIDDVADDDIDEIRSDLDDMSEEEIKEI